VLLSRDLPWPPELNLATPQGVAGLLLGLGALAIPGLGPLVAAGPLAAALAGAGAGAVAGGLMGALTDLGVPEDEARSYVDGLRRGGVLLVVRAEGMMIERAAATLQRHGAVNIDQRAEY
jgi:uncharacterized membrane protein